MKKSFNFILILPLLLAIGFVLVAIRTGSAPNWLGTSWLSTSTPASAYTRIVTSTPLVLPSISTKLTPTTTHAKTNTLTPTPTRTLRPTSTSTSVSTPTLLTSTLTSNPSKLFTGTMTGTPVSAEISDGIAIGNQIIRAIEVYNLDQGHYPSKLDDLVPVYLAEIPVTSTGQQYFYRLFDPTDPLASEIYWLAFRVTEQENVTCTYIRRLGYWDCNFASP